jgi:hypothetical protein
MMQMYKFDEVKDDLGSLAFVSMCVNCMVWCVWMC